MVGIDLGTTNSAVAAMEGGKPTIVTNAEGARTTPSVVAFTKSGDRLVGQIAKRQGVVNPENTFFSVKRFVGRKFNEVQSESTQVPYRLAQDSSGNVKIESSNVSKQFAPEEISASVLRKLADDAGKFLNDKVSRTAFLQQLLNRNVAAANGRIAPSLASDRSLLPACKHPDVELYTLRCVCTSRCCHTMACTDTRGLRRLRRLSSLCQPTSTTHSARPPRMQARLPAWRSCAS